MNTYTPKTHSFDPLNAAGYVRYRTEEAVRANLAGTVEKIDVPAFLADWMGLCKTHFEWLEVLGVHEPQIRSLRQSVSRDVKGVRDHALEAISGDIGGIQRTVEVYEEELGELPDVRSASEGQIALLGTLQQRYVGLQLM